MTPPLVTALGARPAGRFAHRSAAARLTRVARSLPLVLSGACAGAMIPGAALAAEPDLCEGLVTHHERVAVRPVAKPPFMKRYRDPAFGTTVMRITDSRQGEVRKPVYSTVQAWNADESLLMLYRSGGGRSGHVLLDGRTYEPVRELDFVPTDLEEVFWSHTDPDVFYYVSGYKSDLGELKRYSVEADKATTIRDFDEQCGADGLPVAGGDVQMPSLDDDLFGFRCKRGDGSWIAISWRMSTDEVHTMEIGEGTDYQEWYAPMPGPSGERFWFQGHSLTPDLKKVEATMDMAKTDEHSNLGTTHDGRDALFQTVFDPSPKGCEEDIRQGVAHLTEHVLEDGGCRPIISESEGYPYTTSGTHVSAQAWRRPGWVTMSSIGDDFKWFTNKRKAPALFSEIYLANTDPENGVTCRLAQHRSYGKHATRGGYTAYFGEPHATASPSGTRIVFGSDWYDSGAVDTYVIELPAYDPGS